MPVDKFLQGSSGEHRPKVWATRNCFANLGDIRDFNNPGSVGKIYGLEFTKGGLYRRAAIESHTSGFEPNWELKLDLAMRYLDLQSPAEGGITKVVWLMNAGSMFVGYRPSGAEPMTLNGHVNSYYLGPKGANVAKLQAHTAFPRDLEILRKPPKGSVIYLEIETGGMTPSAPIEILPGVSIKWKRPETMGLVIKIGDGEAVLSTNVSDLEANAVAEKISLEFIYSGPSFYFKRLLFSLSPVSDRVIESLTASIKQSKSSA